MVDFNEISKSVITGDTSKAVELTKATLDEGIPAKDILDKGLIPGIGKVGELFSIGQYFLPELLISGEAVEAAIEQLRPVLSQSGVPPAGRYLIGTVQGDVHNIGKNIVTMMLEGNGWEVTDLGEDISPEEFCAAVEEGNYDIVGLSALLTLTMDKQAATIRALEAAGVRHKVKVMIGGAPVTQDYADKIGADVFGVDAVDAVKKSAILVGRC
jgi:5-methyltetrahydrofolate--homocysteine methyltransferase